MTSHWPLNFVFFHFPLTPLKNEKWKMEEKFEKKKYFKGSVGGHPTHHRFKNLKKNVGAIPWVESCMVAILLGGVLLGGVPLGVIPWLPCFPMIITFSKHTYFTIIYRH